MKKLYFLLSLMLITLSGLAASAQKTITVTTNEPSALTVLDANYAPITWVENSLQVTIPIGNGLQMSVNGNYEISAIKMNETALSTSSYISNEYIVDGGTLYVTMSEKQPKTLVIQGDGDQVYIQSNYTDYKKDSQVDGKWTLPNLSEYGTTYVYPNAGYAIKSVKDANGKEYMYPGSTSVSIYHVDLLSGTTEITVTSFDKAAARTASFSVEVTGDASSVRIQRNGENEDVPSSEFESIAYDPENELPVTISHIQYGKTLYKVFVGEEEQTPQGSQYRLSNITNGCKVKVVTDYPEIDVPVKFIFTNEGTENAIQSVNIDNTPLEQASWLAEDFKVRLGKQVSINTNYNDYTINSVTVNGQANTQSFTVTDEAGYTIVVDATKIEPYKLTVITADWENVIIGQPYSSPYVSFPLTGPQSVLEIPRSCYSIEIKAADGYRIDHIFEAGTETELSSPLYLKGDKSIEVYVSEFKRDKVAVVYFEETEWNYKNVTLSANDYNLRKDISVENGYNFINYNEVDRPFAINMYHGSFPNPVVYLNGTKIENNYGMYPDLEKMPENSVIKIFTTEPDTHSVTYNIEENAGVEVAHDYLSIVENPSVHNVQHGTHVVITPAERSGINILANDKAVEANDKGQFIVSITENTTLTVSKEGTSSVVGLQNDDNRDFDIFNMQGIRVMHKANRQDLNNLPAGIYIVNGKKLVKK